MAVLNLFDPGDLASIRARIAALQPSATRQWGTMTPPQMLAHTAISFESACRDDETQRFLGRIVGGFVRPLALNEKPFNKGAPTDPTFVVSDERDFEQERARLLAGIDRFIALGEAGVHHHTHVFFGRLTGVQWGRLMYKHADHHLRQFGG